MEPTARNLLRRPLLLGVPLFGLTTLAGVVLTTSVLFGTRLAGNVTSLLMGLFGYIGLRVMNRLAKSGWEESLIWALERRTCGRSTDDFGFESKPSLLAIHSPDTLTDTQLVTQKSEVQESLGAIKVGERRTLVLDSGPSGVTLGEILVTGRPDFKDMSGLPQWTNGLVYPKKYAYSLHSMPVTTDPLWLFGLLSRIESPFRLFVSIKGMDPYAIKHRIEVSRKSSSRGGSQLSDVDAEVTFEESSGVLRGLSRGEERVFEASLVILSDSKIEFDPGLFCLEKNIDLVMTSVLGLRTRFHRSHLVRAATAADLIPTLLDPKEPGPAILKTIRGNPLYFSPDDTRLEALHWLVVGASGSGKSFFTGLVLKRMIEAKSPMAVFFVDHNRSFRRLVREFGQEYGEPKDLAELERATLAIFERLDTPGGMIGLELSDLSQDEKRIGIQTILRRLELFLRHRESTHPVYLVLDECWNFLREDPLLVQRAFREFRKLNGAAIAITQSLSDFLTDESGQSIFQNAPIRILLRQGEDLGRYQGILGLNDVELALSRRLRQVRGEFSECLIKTPFLSRVGRLYPTEAEHALLRTDNLREEIIREAKAQRLGLTAEVSR